MFLKWNDDALKKKKKTKSSVTTRLEKQENSIHKNESGGLFLFGRGGGFF